jgi:o-succinylbenzoate---CoA ligase
MLADNYLTPEFDLPSSDLQFLATENHLYDYQNLYSFAFWLNQKLKPFEVTEQNPLLLITDSTDQQVFTIAACWLLEIPFLPVSSQMTESEIGRVLEVITPSVLIRDEKTANWLPGLPEIEISREKLEMRKIVDESIFSSGNPQKTIGYLLTSGSSGEPKIVKLKRRQILFGAKASADNFKPDKNRYWLLCLPLNHVGGISIIIRSLLYHSAIFRMDRFEINAIIDYLSDNKLFQVTSLVPTMLNRLIDHQEFHVHNEVKAILLGGGPATTALLQKSAEKGIPVVTSYGMTETFGQIAANPLLKPSGIYHPKKSVGRIFEPNRAEIRNENGRRLHSNETGYIWLKGPQVFDGYADEGQNQDSFDSNGWFNTGDFGYLNRYNQLFIEARRTDLIITGGKNVRPVEVESALEELEAIREAKVIGVPDIDWGETVIAYVVLNNKELFDEDSIRDQLRKKLSAFKIPKKIIPTDQFPIKVSGKTDKAALINKFKREFA